MSDKGANQDSVGIPQTLTPIIRLGSKVLLCVFVYLVALNQAVADYQIPVPNSYSCSRADGGVGSTGNWLSQQETANEWGRLTVLQFPTFTHWWIWNTVPWVPISGYNPLGLQCEADNGIPYIPGVTTSPPYDGMSATMGKALSCSYRTPSGTVTIGELRSYAVGDGTYGYTCTITSAFNPKSLGTCPIRNPVYPSTGNKALLDHDYSSTNLSYSRWYNSAVLEVYRTAGTKWRHTFYRSLSVIGGNDWKALLFRESGRIIEFRLSAGSWLPDVDISDRLVEVKDVNGIRIGWRYSVADDDSLETYSAPGKLLSIADRTGLTQTLTYDLPAASGGDDDPDTLDTVNNNTGHKLIFTYDTYKRISTLTDPAGNITHYGYDANNNLITITYPDDTPADLTNNPKRTYVYGELVNTSNVSQPNLLTGIIDEKGIRYATYQYDTNGKAISTEHAIGGIEKYSLSYATDGSTSVTDPLGSIRTTHFTTVLGVAKSTGSDQPGGSGCAAASSNITYDVNGNVASRTDFNGNRTNYTYDLTRNLETSRTEGLTATGATTPQTRTITTEWHPTFRLPTKITEPGLETTVSYDSKGNITHKSLKDLVTAKTQDWNTTYTYAASGILLQKVEDGPRTDVSDLTTYDYYPDDAVCTGGHLGCRGQLKQVTNALGHVTRITRYSPHRHPEVINDPNGLITTMAYDVRQRLISLDVGGELTTYNYDPAGLMTRVTQASGAYLAYRYDNAHRLIEVKDQLGNTRTYTLDNMGNRIKEDLTDPNGQLARSQSRVYDALSRLQNLILPQ